MVKTQTAHVSEFHTNTLKMSRLELRCAIPKILFACLCHDLVHALIKVDHGWWGVQMFEPYVSENVTFAIRYHQALRFYEDKENGYEYPDLYRNMFGRRLQAGEIHRRHL